MTVKVEGDERVIAGLAKSVLLTEGVNLLTPAAELMADEIRRTAPRDTGQLGGSIGPISVKVEASTGTVIVGPDRTGFYGFFLEYGTSRMVARPWFRPAVDRAIKPAATMIGRTFAEKFQRVWK